LQVGNQIIRYRKAVIATGARAAIPKGLEKVKFLTNSTLFNLTKLPASMIIIGGGPVSCEMAQAFQMFGTHVTIVLRSERLLSSEDEEASKMIDDVLVGMGVSIYRSQDIIDAQEIEGNVHLKCSCKKTGQVRVYKGEQLLVAAGRTANIEDLDLDRIGVRCNQDGVIVDDHLRTSNPDVFAVGDVVASRQRFTHVSGTHAQMVVDNALFQGKRKVSEMVIPHVTYTWPEVASVGLNAREAESKGIQVDVYQTSLAHSDRAILEGLDSGFAKIFCKRGSDEIVGASIVAPCAGELITQVNMCIRFSIGLESFGHIIHSYPSFSESIGGCGFVYKLGHWLVREKYHPKKETALQLAAMSTVAAVAVIAGYFFIKNK